MKIQIEDFETGWFGISMGVKRSEIDLLIDGLRKLKTKEMGHFHVRSNYEGDGGVGDIEIFVEDEKTQDNSVIDLSSPIEHNR